MIKINFSATDVEALRYWRFQHPDPRVQVRMEALYLRSQGVTNGEILRLCGISKASFHRHLKAYVAGGVEQLKRIDHYRPQSKLANHRTTLEAYFQHHPPATVAEAAAKIAEVTGIVRKPTQVRQFLRALGMKPMKVGMIPAKADVDAQEAFKKKSGAQVTGSWGWPARRVFH
jgi:transposase